jgi:hypothetical protein
LTTGSDIATSVALQTDGKIVAAGTSATAESFAVARSTTGGTLDDSFDGDARVATSFTTPL